MFRAVAEVHRRCQGGYAVVSLVLGLGVVAWRDVHGIRPLVLEEGKDARETTRDWQLVEHQGARRIGHGAAPQTASSRTTRPATAASRSTSPASTTAAPR